MSPWFRWTLHSGILAMAATGLACFWMTDVLTVDDPFAVISHPWQPHLLKAHVLLAPALVFLFGILFEVHVRVAMRKDAAVGQRASGWVAAGTLFVMIASGYALQVVTGDVARVLARWTHLVAGLAFSVVHAVHVIGALRSRRTARAASMPIRGSEQSRPSRVEPA
jgi:Lon protease-like protein